MATGPELRQMWLLGVLGRRSNLVMGQIGMITASLEQLESRFRRWEVTG